MLYGKINPPAVSVEQLTPFSSITKTADLMVVVARPYVLGATRVTLQVTFGNGEISGDTVTNFQSIFNLSTKLNQEEIESWGTDDTVIFNEVAKKMGTEIVEIFTGSTGHFGI